MNLTVRDIAALIQGEITGNSELLIQSPRTLQDATSGDITFAENEKYVNSLGHSKASAAIVPLKFPVSDKVLIRVPDPLMSFVKVVQHFQGYQPEKPTGVDGRALVHETAQIGADASIHPFAIVGANVVIGKRCQLHPGVVIGKNCRLGDDVVLFPNVVLYQEIVLGDRVVIHAQSVIGADGFGYRFQDGKHVKVPQLSTVIIGSDVEIGACSSIDRGVFEPTRIGDGTKIDNHVQIAHNCQIGKHNLLAALVGIGGSCTTGNYVTLAGQAGIADHVHVGDRVIVAAQSGLTKNVPAGEVMLGMPARPIRDQRRVIAVQDNLPALRQDVLRIKKHLGLRDAAKPSESQASEGACGVQRTG